MTLAFQFENASKFPFAIQAYALRMDIENQRTPPPYSPQQSTPPPYVESTEQRQTGPPPTYVESIKNPVQYIIIRILIQYGFMFIIGILACVGKSTNYL